MSSKNTDKPSVSIPRCDDDQPIPLVLARQYSCSRCQCAVDIVDIDWCEMNDAMMPESFGGRIRVETMCQECGNIGVYRMGVWGTRFPKWISKQRLEKQNDAK